MSTNMIAWEKDADGIVTLTMDDPDARVNIMNERYRDAMDETLDRLEAEKDGLTGVVLTSAKGTFFAGGDLDSIGSTTEDDAAEIFAETEHIKAQLRRLETLGVPVVAAINGAALGGGFEIALACHHRIALADKKTKIGLPEVSLGLLPGGGGVTRTVRLFGIEKALMEWLLEGPQYSAEEALEKGGVDEVVASAEELVPAAKTWLKENPEAHTKPWDEKGYKIPGGTPTHPGFAQRLPAFPAMLRAKLGGADVPAPKAILSAAVEGAQVDFDTASRIESRYFAGLATGRTSTAMIQAFHTDMQTLRSGSIAGEKGREKNTVNSVAVLGAGMMGAGIAHALAIAGTEVMLKDISLANAEKGFGHVKGLVDKRVQQGKMTAEKAEEILARVTPTESYDDIAHVDAVIEAVFEDFDLKNSVFTDVEKVVGPDTLLCSNTSTLPITQLQQPRERSADMVGLHFFSPVHRMKLVEIIKGEQTSQRTFERAYDLVQQIRKLPIAVNDGRGFYTSRVYGTLILEAVAMVEEGVNPQRIEREARHAGFPASPLAMLDEVSLTLVQHIRAAEEKEAKELGTARPARPGESVIDRMIEDFDRKGRAAGAGFYEYPEEGRKFLWPGLFEHFSRDTEISGQEIQDRLVYRMAIETARCFEDGILTDTASANLGAIFGIGFPPQTGGPATFMVNRPEGLAGFVSRCDELADAHGERFRPSEWLRERAAQGNDLV